MDPSFKITQHFESNPCEEVSPKAPPRYKRKVQMQGVANLNLESISNEEFPHQNDILFRTDSLHKLTKEEDVLKGKSNVNPI